MMDTPLFDIQLNQSYQLINPAVIAKKNTPSIQAIAISAEDDQKEFMKTVIFNGIIIQNPIVENLNELIDFEDEQLCATLEYLEVYGALKHMPDDIAKLRNLKLLILHNVYHISPAVKQLQQLETLLLLNCDNLDYLPFELYEITNLKNLTVNHLNYYENFSPRITQLQHLEFLRLKDHFPYLSPELSKLQNLKYLDIEAPQACIYDIPNLESLYIRVMESKSLEGISKLKKLKELWLDIRQFNEEINELEELKYLVISHYSGQTLPSLDRLHQLEVLVINDCTQLDSIPDFIFKLPRLKYLALLYLENLKTIPAEINDIASLTHLELGDSGYSLPEFRSGLQVHKIVAWNSYTN